jgi:hypothetical protein
VMMEAENILVWNVRGLHAGAHRNAVRDLVSAERLSVVCLQETKLDVISDYDVMQILGAGFQYVYLPGVHTRGGVLVAGLALDILGRVLLRHRAVFSFGQDPSCLRRRRVLAYDSVWSSSGHRQAGIPCGTLCFAPSSRWTLGNLR